MDYREYMSIAINKSHDSSVIHSTDITGERTTINNKICQTRLQIHSRISANLNLICNLLINYTEINN
jgi:hypothetical protein